MHDEIEVFYNSQILKYILSAQHLRKLCNLVSHVPICCWENLIALMYWVDTDCNLDWNSKAGSVEKRMDLLTWNLGVPSTHSVPEVLKLWSTNPHSCDPWKAYGTVENIHLTLLKLGGNCTRLYGTSHHFRKSGLLKYSLCMCFVH